MRPSATLRLRVRIVRRSNVLRVVPIAVRDVMLPGIIITLEFWRSLLQTRGIMKIHRIASDIGVSIPTPRIASPHTGPIPIRDIEPPRTDPIVSLIHGFSGSAQEFVEPMDRWEF
jgi:hypothetical protein